MSDLHRRILSLWEDSCATGRHVGLSDVAKVVISEVAAERERCALICEEWQKHWEMRAAAIEGDAELMRLSYEQDAYMCRRITAEIRGGE